MERTLPGIERSFKQSAALITLARERKTAKLQPDVVDDEYSENPDIEILKPLPLKNDGSWRFEEISKKVTQQLAIQYEYYSKTRGLEIHSGRTQLLQDIADRMVAGTDTVARGVITNKGKDPNAFVCPDG